jgi:hypothetical protein
MVRVGRRIRGIARTYKVDSHGRQRGGVFVGGGSTSRSGSEHGNNKSVQERTDYEHYRSIWCQFHHLVEQNQRAGGGPTASQKRTITSSQNGLGEGSQDPSVAQTSG